MRTANPDNICRVKNFLPLDKFLKFKHFFDTQDMYCDQGIKERAMITVTKGCDYGIYEVVEEYLSDVCGVVSQRFGLGVTDFSGTCFRKWYPGEHQPPHSDCEAIIYEQDDLMKCDPFYNFSSIFLEYAAICYLNDDYEGGEIYFPDYDLSIKPEPNELLFFPGTRFYMHGVKEVTSGNRMVVQNFLTTNKLRYLWEKFIQGEESLNFINYSQEEMFTNKVDFNRSNLPYTSPYRLAIYDS